MYKSKLAEIFFSLSTAEQRALGKFVRSPFHNQREDVVALYDYFYQYRDSEDRSILQKEEAFRIIFPNEPFDADKIDYSMSFLLKTTETFLMVQSLLNEPIEAQIRLAEAYRLQHLDKHFKQSWKQAQQLQEKQPMRDGNYFRRAYRLEYERYAYSALEPRSEEKNLQALTDSFDAYYMGERLKQSCLILAHKAVYKTEYDMGPTELLKSYLESRPNMLTQYPVLGLYYHYYVTLTTTDLTVSQGSFQQFKRMFLEHISRLPADEVHNLHAFSVNYCIRRYNTGSPEYVYEVMELYKAGLQTGILFVDGHLTHSSYLNITKTAIKIKDYEWLADFIEKYKSKVDIKHREAYYNYAKGEFYYSQKQYQDAMIYLQQIEHSDLLMNLGARVILLKIYYELGEVDVMESLLNSMKAYLSRKEQLGYHRENYNNIIRLFRKLISINPYDKKERADLHKEIEASTVTEKQWLLERVQTGNR